MTAETTEVGMRVAIHMVNGDIISDTMGVGNIMDFIDEYKANAADVLTITRESGAAIHFARAHIVKVLVTPEDM